jgi:hypothetical protein
MDAIFVIVITVVCAVASAFLYKKWLQSEIARKDRFSKHIHCVTKGDMYCSHLDWCGAEIALYPKEHEAELKRNEDNMNTEYVEEFQNALKESGYRYSDQYLYSLIASMQERINILEKTIQDSK